MGPVKLAGSGLAPGLPPFVDLGVGVGGGALAQSSQCLCGGMSGMFGIWVFTSQGAYGSLVLK